MSSERDAREAAHQSLQEIVQKEKTAREKHHATYQEFLDREKSAREQHRNSIDDLLSREKAERMKHHETVEGRVGALERTVGIFDEIARKEQADRKADLKRVWDAIDSHTHDLSTSMTKDNGPETLTTPAPTVVRSVTPRMTPVYASNVMSMVQRFETSPKAVAYTGPPLTNSIVSAPVTIIPANPGPTVRAAPAYEARAVVPERERSTEPRQHHHSTETIICGHTRYGGQAHASAQVPLN